MFSDSDKLFNVITTIPDVWKKNPQGVTVFVAVILFVVLIWVIQNYDTVKKHKSLFISGFAFVVVSAFITIYFIPNPEPEKPDEVVPDEPEIHESQEPLIMRSKISVTGNVVLRGQPFDYARSLLVLNDGQDGEMFAFLQSESDIWFEVEFTSTKGFLKQGQFETTEYAVSDVIEYNNHRYQFYDAFYTWNDAKKYCEELGGHLVTITDANENTFLISRIPGEKKWDYYIGAYLESDGKWNWVTGESFEYTFWGENNPDNYNEEENCAALTNIWFDGWYWNDLRPIAGGFICEWE